MLNEALTLLTVSFFLAPILWTFPENPKTIPSPKIPQRPPVIVAWPIRPVRPSTVAAHQIRRHSHRIGPDRPRQNLRRVFKIGPVSSPAMLDEKKHFWIGPIAVIKEPDKRPPLRCIDTAFLQSYLHSLFCTKKPKGEAVNAAYARVCVTSVNSMDGTDKMCRFPSVPIRFNPVIWLRHILSLRYLLLAYVG